MILLSAGFAASAQSGIKWMSWEEAVAANKNEPRLIFVDIYTDWCVWCKRMDKSTFSQPAIIEYMNSHYYNVKLNAESKDTIRYNGYSFYNQNPTSKGIHTLAISLLDQKMGYPSFVILNSDLKRITVIQSYLQAQDFEKVIRYIPEGYLNGQSQEVFLQNFESLIEN